MADVITLLRRKDTSMKKVTTRLWKRRGPQIGVPADKKRCCKCKEIKPLDDFRRDHRKPDGRHYTCKPCYSVIRKERGWDQYVSEVHYRDTVLNHYGPVCACCGEMERQFLSIDHINGGGSAHRREANIRNMARWLVENCFPPGFQILCYNCNIGKRFTGECPHLANREICHSALSTQHSD